MWRGTLGRGSPRQYLDFMIAVQYFRLLEEWDGLRPGTVISAVFDEGDQQFNVSMGGNGTSYFSREKMDRVAEEVSEEEFQVFVANLHVDETSAFSDEVRVSVSGLLGDDEVPTDGTLVTTNKFGEFRNMALALNRKAAGLKAMVAHKTKVLQQHAGALREKLELERANMALQMAGVAAQMAALQHALQMANLYLGSSEIVVPIREGSRAGADEPISIRQRILFMDEECAMLDDDGVDAFKIGNFDTYIQNEDLLQLVLPERKGIVVLKVCRLQKKYAGVDPFTQAALDEENAKTYWLIRNGDCLWRFWADFDAPNKIFPDRMQDISANKPGSEKYYEEMKAEQSANRLSYMKAGLLVQGIIDRTLVFSPFQGQKRPSVTDPESWDGQVVFRYDAEAALGEGKPSFRTWLAGVNKRLLPGQRIVTDGRLPDEDEETISPPGARGYNEANLWTVQNDKRGLFFRFKITDTWRETNRSGTYILQEGAACYINFDAAPVADFDYYLRSREARIDYRQMVPVLRRCLELKSAEMEEEAPFRALLRSMLIAECGDDARVDSELDGLVLWWKGKNKDYRPLCGSDDDNRKAFKAIMAQFNRVPEDAISINDIPLPTRDELALVIQKDPKTVVAYFKSHPDFPPFVNERVWRRKRAGWVLDGERDWISLPPAARVNPRQLFADTAKLEFQTVKHSKFIAKPIIDQLAAVPLAELPFLERAWAVNETPLALITTFEYGSMKVAVLSGQIGSHYRVRELEYQKGGWKYSGEAGGVSTVLTDHFAKSNFFSGQVLTDRYRKIYVVTVATDTAQSLFRKEEEEASRMALAKRCRREYAAFAADALETKLHDLWRDEQYAAYMGQGGDVTLFEDHMRTVKTPEFHTKAFRSVLDELLVHADWSIGAVLKTPIATLHPQAQKLYAAREKSFFDRATFPEKLVLPECFVLPPPAKKD